jgi:hypothetical protein
MALLDAVIYFEQGLLVRCDIGSKAVERYENEYMNLRLITSKYNIFIGLKLKEGSY